MVLIGTLPEGGLVVVSFGVERYSRAALSLERMEGLLTAFFGRVSGRFWPVVGSSLGTKISSPLCPSSLNIWVGKLSGGGPAVVLFGVERYSRVSPSFLPTEV